MTVQPSPYDLLRVIQQHQRATDQLVTILLGMLDQSAPEPLLTFPPPRPEAPTPAKSTAPARKLRRVEGPAGRPPAVLKLGSVDIQTTERRAAIVRALIDQPRTLAAMVESGFAPNTNAMMRQVVDINRDLQFAGSVFRIKPDARPPREGGRGSIAAAYSLVDTSIETTTLGSLTAAQSEAATGSIPEQGADERTAGGGEAISVQSAQFVTPAGEEVATIAAGSSPAADVTIPEPATDAATVAEARPPEVVTPPQPLADDALSPEKLAAVDVLRCRVFGPSGSVYVSTRAARALDVLKHGELFGLDHVAAKAKIPSASDCRHALRIEEASLRSIGLEVWSDKFNARLREVA